MSSHTANSVTSVANFSKGLSAAKSRLSMFAAILPTSPLYDLYLLLRRLPCNPIFRISLCTVLWLSFMPLLTQYKQYPSVAVSLLVLGKYPLYLLLYRKNIYLLFVALHGSSRCFAAIRDNASNAFSGNLCLNSDTISAFCRSVPLPLELRHSSFFKYSSSISKYSLRSRKRCIFIKKIAPSFGQ